MQEELEKGTMVSLPCTIVSITVIYNRAPVCTYTYSIRKEYRSSAQLHKHAWHPGTAASHHILHSAK